MSCFRFEFNMSITGDKGFGESQSGEAKSDAIGLRQAILTGLGFNKGEVAKNKARIGTFYSSEDQSFEDISHKICSALRKANAYGSGKADISHLNIRIEKVVCETKRDDGKL